MELIRPSLHAVPEYRDALVQGWSPNPMRADAATEALTQLHADPAAYVAGLDDPEGRGPARALPGGGTAPALCNVRRWIWDGDFCGVIGLRWQKGTVALPADVLGHIGYGVVPWKRGRGYASLALARMLPIARAAGLPYVDVSTDPDNAASRRVIEKNGGVFVERFVRPAAFGATEALRYRIELGGSASELAAT
jgi:predicted acetyltransferase